MSHSDAALPPLELELESVLPIAQAPRRHPLLRCGRREGRPVARATLDRWWTRGVVGAGGQRVKLKTALVGGTRVTTFEEVSRFVAALNGQPASAHSPAQLRGEHARAEAALDLAGL